MKRFTALILAIVLCASLLTACGGSASSAAPAGGGAPAAKPGAATYTMILGHGGSEETTVHQGYVKFKELIEEKTNGDIIVEIYPNGQLGGDRELIEACTQGNVTLNTPSTAPLANFVPEMYAFEAPFLFANRETAYEILDGEVGDKLLDSLESAGLKGLGYFENGFRNLTTSRDIKTLADMSGMKIRTMENDIHLAIWQAMGTNPAPLAFTELYTALQQGTFDAQENPPESIYFSKLHEVQDYCYLTSHIYSPYIVEMNLDFWNSLTPEYQELVQTCMDEAIDFQRSICVSTEEECLSNMEAEGCQVVEVSDSLRQEMIAACGDVYGSIVDKAGPIADELFAAAGITY